MATAKISDSPAFFFTPHQDDETLSMGASIKEHVASGRKAIVVLLCDGGGSFVRDRYPSREEFVKERDREFVAACRALGAQPVIMRDRAHDMELTVEYAQSVIQDYVDAYPGGSFKTMSEHDGHPDHAALGKALRRVTGTKDKRWYVKRVEWERTGGRFTGYHNIRSALLAYAPVGWISVRQSFEREFERSRNKVYA